MNAKLRRFLLSAASLLAITAVYAMPSRAEPLSCQYCKPDCDESYCNDCLGATGYECGTVSCPLGGVSTLCWQ